MQPLICFALDPHVFIIHEGKQAYCSSELCPKTHQGEFQAKGQGCVILEPLFDVASLSTASDLNVFGGDTPILTFRRNDYFDKLGIDINVMMPDPRLVFCIGCLKYIWNKRMETWTVARMQAVRKRQAGLDLGQRHAPQITSPIGFHIVSAEEAAGIPSALAESDSSEEPEPKVCRTFHVTG